MRVLITGGCGFIGSHVVEHILKNTDWEIVVLDKLGYSSEGMDRLRDIKAFNYNRVRVITCDLGIQLTTGIKREIGNSIDYILHLAAETHVDNSIADPLPFIQSNIFGTYTILQYARELKNLKAFNYFSTDEIFGHASIRPVHWGDVVDNSDGPGEFFINLKHEYLEWDRYNSRNPYSATKAAGEELALAWANTYKLPVIISHCMNCFGERQHPEKFIPKVVRSILLQEKIQVHIDKKSGVVGSRSYIHCRNVASALLFLLSNFHHTDKFNITGEQEVSNLDLVTKVSKIIGKETEVELMDVGAIKHRPGHDIRYALSGSKMEAMGWTPGKAFDESLERTIKWMIKPENLKWLNLRRLNEKGIITYSDLCATANVG